MATANEELVDRAVRHAVFLERFKGGQRNKLLRHLERVEDDILAKLARLDPTRAPVGSARLNRLLDDIREIMGGVNRVSLDELRVDLREFAVHEAEFAKRSLESVSPVILETVLPSATTVWAAVNSRPFYNRILREWVRDYDRLTKRNITGAVEMGVSQGEPIGEIIRSVRRIKGFQGNRLAAQALVRTAVNHISTVAREQVFEANQDILVGLRWTAVLDGRTTRVCSARDGEVAAIGGKPIPDGETELVPNGARPPAHPNCRSIMVGVLDVEVISQRPAIPATQKGLLRDFAQENNLGSITRRRDLPRGYKGKFDAFSRQRIRELTGRIPSKETYQSWLKRQSVPFQDDVLGKTKGQLFRKGGLSLDKFVDRQGNELTLAELRLRDAEAFERAGL